MLDYLEHLRRESRRFRDVLADAAPGDRVPSCPDWEAADLLWHLTEVQHFWGSIVAERLQDPEDASDLIRPHDYAQLLGLFDQGSTFLIDALTGADPSDRVWTWSDDHSVGFIRRRQTHEALIHRSDAEMVVGKVGPVDRSLAADGIDEILRVMIGSVPEWGSFEPDGCTVRIESRDHPGSWGIALGRFVGTSPTSGNGYDEPAATVGLDAVEPDVVIAGDAADLDLWLWGRGPLDRLDVVGDGDLVARLRDLAVEVTQ